MKKRRTERRRKPSIRSFEKSVIILDGFEQKGGLECREVLAQSIATIVINRFVTLCAHSKWTRTWTTQKQHRQPDRMPWTWRTTRKRPWRGWNLFITHNSNWNNSNSSYNSNSQRISVRALQR